MRYRPLFLLALALPALAVAPLAAADLPLRQLPYTPSLDPAAMDRSVDPCVDLYSYSCGGWMKANPIPPDQASWSVYGKVTNENLAFLWGLLEAAAKPDPGRDAASRQIGDYFAACMDEAAVEHAGVAPLKTDLDAIAALHKKAELAALLGRLHLGMQTSGMLFGFGSNQDFGDSSRVIAFAFAGGLGLPDRDYYLKDDAKSKETRERYLAHLRRMFELLGDAPQAAAGEAATVMRIETALASASLTRVERRDPYKIYHLMKSAKLQELTPSFRWSDYLAAAGLPGLAEANVTQPAFFQKVESLLGSESLGAWQTYLRWALVNDKAAYLSAPFVTEDFDFYRRYLRGVAEMQPRWKRCVQYVDRDLGEALGQVFVEKTFAPATKARTLDMTRRVEKAMEARLRELPWMGEATKREAFAKLASLRNKIGYPDRWRDYGALAIERGDFLGNVDRATAFESKRQLAKIGKPVDLGEWTMTPPTVNAYYNPSMNDINFPAGVLQPPLFDPKLDDAPNYGNTGSTIGHELTHGFDDQGRRFDAKGNLRDWWTAADAKEFEARSQCIVDQYSQYTIVDDIKINGKLTLGEDVADLGGTILAYLAWKDAVAGQDLRPVDGLSPDQRFFVGFAQWACTNERDENKRVRALTDPHSPAKYRINGVVVNMPEFARAFACKPGQPMVKKSEEVCRVW